MLKLPEIVLLREIDQSSNYAYSLARTLGYSQSSMTYMLKRLASLGYCQTRIVENVRGPHRIYYQITQRGRTILRKDALFTLSTTQRDAEKAIALYSHHQKTIQLLREIGGL